MNDDDVARIIRAVSNRKAQCYLAAEAEANERFIAVCVARLRQARTPSEVKVDAVIAAMKAHNFRERLPELLADPDLDVDGESRMTCITPLALACGNLKIEQVRLLLKRGAAVDKAVASSFTPGYSFAKGSSRTPLAFALAKSQQHTVLYGVGSLPTPRDVASAMLEVIELLIDHGAALEPFWEAWGEDASRAGTVRFFLREAIPILEAKRLRRKAYNLERWRRVTDFLVFRVRVLRLFHSLYIPSGAGAKRARAEFEACQLLT